jgi:hypothetical protein
MEQDSGDRGGVVVGFKPDTEVHPDDRSVWVAQVREPVKPFRRARERNALPPQRIIDPCLLEAGVLVRPRNAI